MFEPILVFIIAFYFLAIIIALLFRNTFNNPDSRGKSGEKQVSSILAELPTDKYITLNDILLDSNEYTSQIDHVVLSCYGIFVIETKNYKGWIFGSNNAETWIQNIFGRKFYFRNPIKQNFGHKKNLQRYLHLQTDESIISIIAFSNEADLKIKTDSNVIYFCDLINCITKYNTLKFSMDEIRFFSNLLSPKQHYSRKDKHAHITSIQMKKHSQNKNIERGICPRCGGQLVLRTGKYGSFYGCTNYPKCKFTQRYEEMLQNDNSYE